MNVIRHHAPRQKQIPVFIKMHQRVCDNFSYPLIAHPTLASVHIE